MSLFKNIKSYFPKDGNETEKSIIKCYKGPRFISLKANKLLNKNW